MPMSPELQRMLDEYVESLPWYKRWPLKLALAFDGPRAGGMGCLVLVILFVLLIGAMNAYASGCANGTIPGWACP